VNELIVLASWQYALDNESISWFNAAASVSFHGHRWKFLRNNALDSGNFVEKNITVSRRVGTGLALDGRSSRTSFSFFQLGGNFVQA
jgi:hypothetical protein